MVHFSTERSYSSFKLTVTIVIYSIGTHTPNELVKDQETR